MTIYELLLFLHIAATIIWLGAAFALTLLAFGAARANDIAAKATVNAHQEYLAVRLFIPAALGTLIFGLLLVAEGSWSLDQLWIVIGLAGFLVSFLTGTLYFKPEGERIDELVERHGPGHPEVTRRIEMLEAVGRIELAILFLVAADMAIKPTGDDVGILLVGVAIVAVVGVLALSAARREPALPAPAD
jgi:uncharacterized membrane protein